MEKNNLGYCCLCLSLEKQGITTNRGMIKKTFDEKGLEYVSLLATKNTKDLSSILRFNSSVEISLYRMSSDMFPWMSEYELCDLPNFSQIKRNLKEAGNIAAETKQRLTFHPSHFCVIASNRSDVVEKSTKELRQHAEIMDYMGLEQSHRYPINIHINTTKPDKESAANRFISVFKKLPYNVRNRLVLENDDKGSQFTPTDLFNLVYKKVGIPLTYDFLHHQCNPDGLSREEGLNLCLSTWPSGIRPITHYSDSRKIYEDSSVKEVAHSDWIWNKIETYNKEFDIELEVKSKDLALLKYLETWKDQKK
jgi:UV DNA damage endonuclease